MEPEQTSQPVEEIKTEKPKTWWITQKKKPSVLKFHFKNPRVITDKGIDKMQESMSEFGYVTPVAINLNNVIISGHKRIAALMDWDKGDEEIDVRVPNRLLSNEEHEKLMLLDNKMEEGNWDWDKLNNQFEEALLEEVGFTEIDLGGAVEPEEANEPKAKKQKFKEVSCPNCSHVFNVEV